MFKLSTSRPIETPTLLDEEPMLNGNNDVTNDQATEKATQVEGSKDQEGENPDAIFNDSEAMEGVPVDEVHFTTNQITVVDGSLTYDNIPEGSSKPEGSSGLAVSIHTMASDVSSDVAKLDTKSGTSFKDTPNKTSEERGSLSFHASQVGSCDLSNIHSPVPKENEEAVAEDDSALSCSILSHDSEIFKLVGSHMDNQGEDEEPKNKVEGNVNDSPSFVSSKSFDELENESVKSPTNSISSLRGDDLKIRLDAEGWMKKADESHKKLCMSERLKATPEYKEKVKEQLSLSGKELFKQEELPFEQDVISIETKESKGWGGKLLLFIMVCSISSLVAFRYAQQSIPTSTCNAHNDEVEPVLIDIFAAEMHQDPAQEVLVIEDEEGSGSVVHNEAAHETKEVPIPSVTNTSFVTDENEEADDVVVEEYAFFGLDTNDEMKEDQENTLRNFEWKIVLIPFILLLALSCSVKRTSSVKEVKDESPSPAESHEIKDEFSSPTKSNKVKDEFPSPTKKQKLAIDNFDLSVYEEMKVVELREELRARKCKYGGRKEVLIHRLAAVYKAELESQTVKQLHRMLKSKGFIQTGRKVEIIRVLVEAGIPR